MFSVFNSIYKRLCVQEQYIIYYRYTIHTNLSVVHQLFYTLQHVLLIMFLILTVVKFHLLNAYNFIFSFFSNLLYF